MASNQNRAAKDELQDILENLTEEEKQAFNPLPLYDLPINVRAFNSLIRTLPQSTQQEFQSKLDKFRRLNALMDISNGKANENTSSDKQETKKEKDDIHKTLRQIQKYSVGIDKKLFESVLISGVPCFVSISHDGQPEILSEVEEADRILKPFERDSNPIEQYSFATLEELKTYMERAQGESLDTLWTMVEQTVRSFNDTDERNICIMTANIIFSYFQDIIGMTHYLFAVGQVGTGKGSMLEIMHQLAYRAVLISNATAPNLYRMLGSIEKGQIGALLMDEANTIENDIFIMEVLKTGYKGSSRIPRIVDASSSKAQQVLFYTFGFKMIAAEKLPNEWKARGLLDRSLIVQSFYGKPKYRIDKVIEPRGDPRLQRLREQLTELRNLLFAFRLVNYDKPIMDIKLNLDGREEELCSGLIRLFKDTKVLEKVKMALMSFIVDRREVKANSLEAALHNEIQKLVHPKDSNPTIEVEFGVFFEQLRNTLECEPVQDNPNTVFSRKLGIKISTITISKALKNAFGARTGTRDATGTKRMIQFNVEKLKRNSRIFEELPESIEIIPSDQSDHFDRLWTITANPMLPESQVTLDRLIEDSGNENAHLVKNDAKEDSKNQSEQSEVSGKASPRQDLTVYKCPYCRAIFKAINDVTDHGIRFHPGRAVTADVLRENRIS